MEENELAQFDKGDLLYLDQAEEKLSRLCRWYLDSYPKRKESLREFLDRPTENKGKQLEEEVRDFDWTFHYLLYLVSIYLAKRKHTQVKGFLRRNGLDEKDTDKLIEFADSFPNPIKEGAALKRLSGRQFKGLTDMLIRTFFMGDQKRPLLEDYLAKSGIPAEIEEKADSFFSNLNSAYIKNYIDKAYIFRLFECCKLPRRRATVYLELLRKIERIKTEVDNLAKT